MIYGSDSVISHLAAFERTGAILAQKKAANAFAILVLAMRRDSGSIKATATEDELMTILFGTRKFEG
ncbi:hypothetical protein [Hyphomicrobium sulfonivorans]|uniref:hypothetical protein n=1 Tax=Hyphomicrobium sulfonivorans TaxID=121290 RepID=UPI00156DC3DF|nr:hypothetical protein [Hyphomicrobium sulfonivorans]MBI1650413.1 hypothetical protein [Hyphomicrobium sulfonivorans]NSL72226.1 hypothetical protein [Hyphomicrobium sulfonivorans]